MPVGGGLVKQERKGGPVLQEAKLSGAYKEAGQGVYTIVRDGLEMAKEADPTATPTEGWCIIEIQHGREAWDNGPVPITVNSWTIVAPRGKPIFLPIEHLNVLSDAVETKYFQPSITQNLQARHGRRFEFRVIAWPKGYDKKQLDNAMERHQVIELDQ